MHLDGLVAFILYFPIFYVNILLIKAIVIAKNVEGRAIALDLALYSTFPTFFLHSQNFPIINSALSQSHTSRITLQKLCKKNSGEYNGNSKMQ